MWKFAPAIACATPSSSSRRSAIRRADDARRADDRGGPAAGILNVINGDKEAVDGILDDPDIKAVRLRRLHADRAVYL